MAKNERLTIDLIADLSQLSRGLDKGADKIRGFANKVPNLLATAVKGFAILGGAIAAATAGMFALTNRTAQAGDAIAKMAKRTGLSIKFLSEMKHVLDLNDASLESLGISARGMARTLLSADEESIEAKRALEALGLNIDELKQMRPDDLFMAVMHALSKMENVTLRAAYAQRILGRSGEAMLPTVLDLAENFDKARAEAEKFGLVWSEKAAKDAEEFADALTRVKNSVTGVTQTFTRKLLPIGADTMNRLAYKMAALVPVADRLGTRFADWLARTSASVERASERVKNAVVSLVRRLQQQLADIEAAWNRFVENLKAEHPRIAKLLERYPELLKIVAENLVAATTAVIAFRTALIALSVALKVAAGGLNPWLAIPALIGVAIWQVIKNNEKLLAMLKQLWEWVKARAAEASAWLGAKLAEWTGLVLAFWETHKATIFEWWGKIKGWASAAWGWATAFYHQAVAFTAQIIEKLLALWERLKSWWVGSGFAGAVNSVWNESVAVFQEAVEVSKAQFARLMEFVGPEVERWGAWLKAEGAKFLVWWGENKVNIIEALRQIGLALVQTVGIIVDAYEFWNRTAWPVVKPALELISYILRTLISGAIESIHSRIAGIAALISGDIAGTIQNLPAMISPVGTAVLSMMATWLDDATRLFWRWVKGLWSEFEKWILATLDGFIGRLAAVWERVKKLFDFGTKGSPSMYDVFSRGLANVQGMFADAGGQLGDALKHAAYPSIEAIAPASAAQAAAPAAAPNVSVALTINGGLIDQRFLNESLIPQLERAIHQGYMKLRVKQ